VGDGVTSLADVAVVVAVVAVVVSVAASALTIGTLIYRRRNR
jgi:hypothetical protein